MSSTPTAVEAAHHHARRMVGRDPNEAHRVATSLEALFDLTFAACFGLAASQLAQAVGAGDFTTGLLGFGIAGFGICWAWINFSWFASAYDTDDWLFRVATLVQMVGVLVLATGLPRLFASIKHGQQLDATVMVLGYVIMRVAMVFQWLRAAREDPAHRRACSTYAVAIAIAQAGWLVLILFRFRLDVALGYFCLWLLVELAGPYLAERKDGGTPWHAHHIAERYGLFVIIALGEGVVGTVASLLAEIDVQGWTLDAALVAVAGIGLVFGIWWVYSMLPSARVLHAHRLRAFVWGYGQMLLVVAIIATGAGLDVAAHFIRHDAEVSPLTTVLATAIPVSVFLACSYAIHYFLVRQFDVLHLWLLVATAAVVAAAIVSAAAGADIAVCLVILALAPVVTIVGYELLGYRRQATALAHH